MGGGHLIPGASGSIWFRKWFAFHPDSEGGELFLSHLVDDGAVFYLNGKEFFRYNIPAGPVSSATRSRHRVTTVAQSRPWKVPGNIWTSGTNLLAASLHRAPVRDFDLAFACLLEAEGRSQAQGPILLTVQPSDGTGQENTPITFVADAAGAAGWQWYQNGNLVPGATNRIWRIPRLPAEWNERSFMLKPSTTSIVCAVRKQSSRSLPTRIHR